ncbi:hypothetical protein JHK86_000807 [Glycine max]|nr:hypothetical protein JHK86_000807 [Glycine max]
MATLDFDVPMVPTGEPSSNVGPSSKKPKHFEIKKWNVVTLWAWDIVVDNCAICWNHIMDLWLKKIDISFDWRFPRATRLGCRTHGSHFQGSCRLKLQSRESPTAPAILVRSLNRQQHLRFGFVKSPPSPVDHHAKKRQKERVSVVVVRVLLFVCLRASNRKEKGS